MLLTRRPRPLVMLAVTMFGQLAATMFVQGAPFLIPYLVFERGLTLWQAGIVVSSPIAGMMLTLFAWGAVADRVGEKFALSAGLSGLTAFGVGAAFAPSTMAFAVLLMAGGMAGASVNSAGGRVVLGWFPRHRRGLVMGIRQTAQLFGVGAAALVIPMTMQAGLTTAMLTVASLCGVGALLTALFVADPPRPELARDTESSRARNPYRADRRLWRIHAASMFLSVPQMAVATFALMWLVDERSFAASSAGALLAATQLWGAAARVGAGWWSDRWGTRMRPMRMVAVGAAVVLLGLAMMEGTPFAVPLLLLAAVLTVAPNGLALVAVAEVGGSSWAARAMGAQNTTQFLAASATPPLMGLAIAALDYEWAFVLMAAGAVMAIPLIPVKSEFRVATAATTNPGSPSTAALDSAM